MSAEYLSVRAIESCLTQKDLIKELWEVYKGCFDDYIEIEDYISSYFQNSQDYDIEEDKTYIIFVDDISCDVLHRIISEAGAIFSESEKFIVKKLEVLDIEI